MEVEVLVYTPQEVAEWAQVPQAFVTTAMREGKQFMKERAEDPSFWPRLEATEEARSAALAVRGFVLGRQPEGLRKETG